MKLIKHLYVISTLSTLFNFGDTLLYAEPSLNTLHVNSQRLRLHFTAGELAGLWEALYAIGQKYTNQQNPNVQLGQGAEKLKSNPIDLLVREIKQRNPKLFEQAQQLIASIKTQRMYTFNGYPTSRPELLASDTAELEGLFSRVIEKSKMADFDGLIQWSSNNSPSGDR